MEDSDQSDKLDDQDESEELVEVEPEIVLFTDDGDTNVAFVDQDVQNENSVHSEPDESDIMPVMPFDLSSSYIYLIGDTDVDIKNELESNPSCDEEDADVDILDDDDDDQPFEPSIPHCEICQQSFSDPKDLKVHYENFHVKLKKTPYSCHICKKTFSTSALLQAHDQSPCVDKRKIQCRECGAEFASTYLFSHHFKIEHEKKLVCVVCQKVHTSEAALMHHLQIHNQKKYSCDKCSVKCDTIYELISHNKTHSKTLLYACNKCDAAFSVVPDLAFHIRSQHGKSKKVGEVVK